jgi:GTP-binding protein
MKITSAEFITSAAKPEQFPRDGRPEVAFVGRSNVGKSTLLNILLQRKGLAKTSKKPGKTRLINFFDVNKKMYFVDLPGYGFAKVSKSMRAEWGRAITGYLQEREQLRLAVHLIDSRHPPTPLDQELLDLLEEAEVPTLIVATKIDKLKANERARLNKVFRNELGLDDEAEVLPYSAVSGTGHKELWQIIQDMAL